MPQEYALQGPQIEPNASYWFTCEGEDKCCLPPHPVTFSELTARTELPGVDHFPEYPDPDIAEGQEIITQELQELRDLEQFRDEPNMISSSQPGRERCPVSLFLQLRQQQIGATINTARESGPVIRTGRELARFFENNTPGESHRQALSYLIGQTGFSPPRQALIWAGLDITVYSALSAAWYYKWLSPRRLTSRRPRPVEVDPNLNVLFDFAPNSTNSDDLPPRQTIPGRPAIPPRPIVSPFPPNNPGTPRHPAYPSGHSTYAGAASEYMSFFFPDFRQQFDHLADNAGLARLWAGIHYRSDHLAGLCLGRTVARLVIEQMRQSGIGVVLGDPEMSPPDVAELETRRDAFKATICCNDDPPNPKPICQPMCPVTFTEPPEEIGPDKRQSVVG